MEDDQEPPEDVKLRKVARPRGKRSFVAPYGALTNDNGNLIIVMTVG